MTQQSEHPQEWLPELALGVLDEDMAEPVRAHVEGCDTCRAEYELMAEVVDMLPLAADAPAPEPEGRERLMERIRSEPRELSSPPGVWRRWMMPAAAAAVLAIVVGTGAFFAGRDSAPAGDQELDQRQDAIVRSAAEGSLDVARGGDGSTQVSVVRAPASQASFAMVEGLPELPDGKAYQAWFTPDGEYFEPSDVFDVSDGEVWLSASRDMEQYVAMAFTIEDAEGVDAPTQDPFVVIPFERTARAR